MNRIRMLRSMTAVVSVAVVMVAFATPAAAAPAPDPLWVATDDDPFGGYDTAEAVAVDPVTGNVYVNGTGSRANNSDDFATIGYTAAGEKLWKRAYSGRFRGGHDAASDIAVDPATGHVFVTGSSQGADGSSDFATVAYSRTGRPLWVARYAGPDAGVESAKAIAVDSGNGNVYVTGTAGLPAAPADFVTVAYSRTGQELWARGYDGPKHGTDTATEIAVDEQTGVVHVAGNSRLEQDGEIGENAYVTLAYSASGSRLWTVRQTNLPGVRNYLAGLGLTPAGATVILGRSEEAGERFEHQLIAYGTSGEELWTASVGPPIPSGLTSPSMPAAATSTPCRSTTTAACTSRPRRTAPVASRCGPPRTPRRTSPSTSLQISLSTPRVATSTSSVGPEPAPKWTS
ncbi:MAG: hypothetical protein ACR2JK_01015 [Geodermatophilaceae bacterium]